MSSRLRGGVPLDVAPVTAASPLTQPASATSAFSIACPSPGRFQGAGRVGPRA